ncbi:hypothetical protein ACQP3C_29500, partial [Escherichia coli]
RGKLKQLLTAKHGTELQSRYIEGGEMSKTVKTRLMKPIEILDLNKGKLLGSRQMTGNPSWKCSTHKGCGHQ